MTKPPVVGSIKTIGDVKRALYNMQTYFEGINKTSGNITIEGLTIAKSKAINVDESWTLKGLTIDDSGNVIDDKKHVTITINGIPVKLAILK